MKYSFIGAGNMGAALMRGMVRGGFAPGNIFVYNKTLSKAEALAGELGITVCSSLAQAAAAADAIVLAVPPQAFEAVLGELGPQLSPGRLIISIAAGHSIAAIRHMLNAPNGIIRIMPNVNASVSASTSGYTAQDVGKGQLDSFLADFASTGTLIELEESEFEIFAAIAGCGVAYVYMFIDAMARAGVKNGLNKAKALSIAASTVAGSAKLISSSAAHPYALIDSVTTPGGTTIEGVLSLQQSGFESAVHKAIQASIAKEALLKAQDAQKK